MILVLPQRRCRSDETKRISPQSLRNALEKYDSFCLGSAGTLSTLPWYTENTQWCQILSGAKHSMVPNTDIDRSTLSLTSRHSVLVPRRHPHLAIEFRSEGWISTRLLSGAEYLLTFWFQRVTVHSPSHPVQTCVCLYLFICICSSTWKFLYPVK